MAYLDYEEAFEDFKGRALEGISKHFPVEGREQTLVLKKLEVDASAADADDIEGQHAAKVGGLTFSRPVMATLALRDNKTGKEFAVQRMKLGEIPLLTRRYSYIVGGQEYQVDNQWQLKPGAYIKRSQAGGLEARFNVPNRPFDITFDPQKKQFTMKRGKSKSIPLYPIMKAMGVDDDTLEKEWGKDVLEANKGTRGGAERFYKADRKAQPSTTAVAEQHVRDALLGSMLHPDVTELTLGKRFDRVEGDTLTRATVKMLQVQAGAAEDDRDSLVFKDLRSVGDYAYDKLTDWRTARSIRSKMSRQINTAQSPRDVVRTTLFSAPLMDTFRHNAAVRSADQVNPVEMIASSMATTVMGPGGIQSDHAVVDQTKYINPSHFGFLDPLHTPEGSKTGITLHLPMGAKKVGHDIKIPVYNIQSGKREYIGPREFMASDVVLPDQVKWREGKPVPVGPKVRVSSKNNEFADIPLTAAKYAMFHPSQSFSMTSNLIPFMGNTSGNRASYATAHIEQAISLTERDQPLVQVSTGAGKVGARSFEELIGRRSGHLAPVAGTVKHVDKKAITVQGDDGTTHRVQLYDNFPLNDTKSVLSSTPLVGVGDKVRAGDPVADTNFTRNGTLALGKNLNVAYIPFRGYNFEDGVVISESAAHALRSEHLYKPSSRLQETEITAPNKFQIQHPESYRKEQYGKLGNDGVIQVGQRVAPGDPLILSTKLVTINDRSGIARIRKGLAGQHTDASLRWEGEHTGEVVGVHRNNRGEVSVHVRTVEPMQVGDKITGRYGNKGIITKVVPDAEMPRTVGGEVVQVALNPAGVPGRMNVGQVLETALSKVAKKTGQPLILDNFEHGVDQVERAQQELKKHGLTDQEELIDPATGKSLGPALFGTQHMLKLRHQVDKKVSVRSGMSLRGEAPESYDVNLIPTSGGKSGGQSLGNLGLNVLLAHGAKANIREFQTIKSEGNDPAPEGKRWASQHREVWQAIQLGEPLPTPKPTFAFQKFTDMLRASGVNVTKTGNRMQLSPLTDQEVLSMSAGELKYPSRLTYAKVDQDGNLKPRTGGLFDERITGGVGGKKWSHFRLAEPMPNPMFENAIQKVLGLGKKQYEEVVGGEKALSTTGALVVLGEGETGGAAIAGALRRLDVTKELEKARRELESAKIPSNFAHGASTQKLDTALKKVKYLGLLQEKGMKPHDAYVLNNLPVLPPAMRPPSILSDGGVKWEDVNGLYAKLAQNNEQMQELKGKAHLGVGDLDLKEHRKALYDGLRALVGVGQSAAERSEKMKGYMQLISPPGAVKTGYFQKTLLSRRQDMSMRSTIVPEPAMGLDDVGVPGEQALKLFRPFVINKMVSMGVAPSALEAQEILRDKGAIKLSGVQQALDKVMEERPLLLKRDPALHKHSIQAFKSHRVKGSAIQIHPLVVSGYNADFDGDAMSMYVPVSQEAVEEARNMMPTKNLFNEATGRVTFTPTLESALGLYKLTDVRGTGKKHFDSPVEAMKAVQRGEHGINELAQIKGMGKTTPGRTLLAAALPLPMQEKMLHDHTFRMNGRGVSEIYGQLAKEHRTEFGDAANKLKDIGFDASYGLLRLRNPSWGASETVAAAEDPKRSQVVAIGTHSLSLRDLAPDKKVRDPIVRATERRVGMIQSSGLTRGQKDTRIVEEWEKATSQMQKEHLQHAGDKPDNLFKMLDAGIKPKWDQYQQLKLAPMLLEDASGRTIPTPVTRSYSEGLDMAGYWIQSSGARKGSIQKVQEVQDPGYFSKQLINTTMNLVVNGDDCGTSRGVGMPVSSSDVHDRELATDLSVRGRTFSRGTLLSPDVVGQIRRLDKNAHVVVRSTLKCEHGEGLCQKCAGISPTGAYYDKGTNLGVLAAQSLGERATQLALKAFHSGGVKATGGKGTLGMFERTKQLTLLPKKIPDEAMLAMHSGIVEKVENDRTGTNVWVGGMRHFVPKDSSGRSLTTSVDGRSVAGWVPPKEGAHVDAGQSLSDPARSFVNPHQLYKATNNIEKVQNFLTTELHGIYRPEGVRRQHVETVVKAMSNLTRVRDPGDADGILKGEYQSTSKLRALNAQLQKGGKRPVVHSPIMKGIDVMPRVMQEDWMAKLNYNRLATTLTDAAAKGEMSDLHGLHPIPGAAYGAEFGMSAKHQFSKPHLKDVPPWAY